MEQTQAGTPDPATPAGSTDPWTPAGHSDKATPKTATGHPRATGSLGTSPWSPGLRGMTVGMVGLIALTAFESLAVTTAMPVVAAALHGIDLYAVAFAAPAAASVVGIVAAGGWSDRAGPARPLLAGIAGFVAGLVVAGTAGGMATVVVGRAVMGLGAGAIYVAVNVVVGRLYPPAAQARVFAALAAAWVVPSLVGPGIAGWLAQDVGWRWVFLSVPILAACTLPALRPVLTRRGAPPAVEASGPHDPAGGRILRGIGAGAGALALHWGGQQSVGVAVAAGVVGVALLAVTVPALLPAGTLRYARGLPAVVALRGVLGAAFFGAEVYLPLILTTERGMRPAQAGLALTVAAITWSVGSWARGRAEGRWADVAVLRWGAALLAAGIGSVVAANWEAVPVAVTVGGWGLSGLGMGLAYPTTSLLTLRLSPPERLGANSAALQVTEALSMAVALAAMGPVFARLVDTSASTAFLATLALPAALALAATATAGRVHRR